MFAVHKIFRVPPKDCVFVSPQFWASKNAVLVKSFSSRKSSPGVCENDSDKSLTVSYLISSCGLSSKKAITLSEKKLCFKSPEIPDAVLKLLREYGFPDSHISNIVTRWPLVLVANPNQDLLPKLEFLCSIGVPRPALARRLSVCASVLMSSLVNFLIPLCNVLKSLLQSDERVFHVLLRAPRSSGCCLSKVINSNISMLRERGVPESSIVTLAMCQPYMLTQGKEKLALYVDRAVEMGFDVSKRGFINAIQVFVAVTESTLKRKMEVYRRCGWSESDISVAFLRHPLCLNISEDKIIANMDFLVNEFGCRPADVAQYPVLLFYNLENRIKPRCLVARILDDKGLMKNMIGVATLLKMSEGDFLKRFVVNYEKDIPELLDIYRGKLSPPEMGFQ